MTALLLVHAAATLALFGLIWTVQLVHYPMFAGLRTDEFRRWHELHATRISLIVGPLMGIEAVTAALLCIAVPPGVPAGAVWFGLALVLAHIASTGLLQVPLHRRLNHGFDADAARRLVTTNWVRTGVWTARAALVLFLLAVAR